MVHALQAVYDEWGWLVIWKMKMKMKMFPLSVLLLIDMVHVGLLYNKFFRSDNIHSSTLTGYQCCNVHSKYIFRPRLSGFDA